MLHFIVLAILITSRTKKCVQGQVIENELSPEKISDSTNSSRIPAGACFIGQIPENGWVENIRPPFRKLSNEYVNSANSVTYKCKDNHIMEGPVVNTCFNGEWISAAPECKPYCSPNEISGTSIVPHMCSHNGVKIKCSDPVPPGAVANITCREWYQRDLDKSGQVTFCGVDGVWTPPPQNCSISCGILTQNITKSPWSVEIINLAKSFDISTGGTIINERIVLSTARGFWNRTQQKTNDLSHYRVLIGLSQTIDQRIEIERISYAPNFNKFDKFTLSGTIVLVVLLTSIEFKSGVVPVCVPFERSVSNVIRSSLEGRTLQQTNVQPPVLTSCDLKRNSTIVPLAAIDLLCIELQEEDFTGFSFDVPITKNGSEVFYLLGTIIQQERRDQGIYTFYQNVLFYKEFIQNEISKVNGKALEATAVLHSVIDSKIRSSTTSPSNADKTNDCRADNIPNRGNAYYEVNDQKIEFGEKIQNSVSILYQCIENHVLYGNSTNICQDGKWIYSEPECKPRCNPEEIQGWTLVANCRFQEDGMLRQTSCTEPAVPGTIASINCQRGYERFGSYQQTSLCEPDGRWTPLPEKCTPVCGEISQGGAYIISGHSTEISKVPWHAGIYRKYRMSYGSEQVCGGSIITAKVIVSAMHCFWNPSNDRINNKEEYEVAVGKSRRQFDEPEKFKPQFFKVENIFYENGYTDSAGYYANDIAIVILNNFIEFKSYIAPVCIQFGLKYDDRNVQPGLQGKVAGWGLVETGGEPSPVIKEIELPVISRVDCIEKSPMEYIPFITSDKFCVGYLSGIGVCQGDSGGGLVIPETDGFKTVYFLRGIVSSGANKKGSCDNSKYTTFTNVAYFSELIQKYYLEYQPNL